jgi:glycosyltransferase involved in cell wall biosynthesis
MRICFVTQEYPNIGRSGGIGTYVSSLSKILGEEHSITVLYCGNATIPKWPLGDQNVEVVFLDKLPRRKYSGGINNFYGKSLSILDWLLTRNFDHVNFPDFQGLAIASIQAKQSGLFQYEPCISVTVHGPNRWALDANNKFFRIEHHAEIEYFERYSIRFSDLVIFPSLFICNWVKTHGWEIANDNLILQNPVVLPDVKLEELNLPGIDSREKVICFFGRLEPRKGVTDFLVAATPQLDHAKFVLVGGESPGNDPFDGFEKDSPVRNVEILGNLNSIQAQSLFKKHQALVVVPSLSENCPYSIIETATFGNKVIASRVGGIPELLPTDSLFNSVSELSQIIEDYIYKNDNIGKNSLLVSNEIAKINYRKLYSENRFGGMMNLGIQNLPSTKFGIVIAHYNQADFLPKALLSVQKQSFENFVCVTIDDGSNEDELKKFQLIADSFKNDSRFIFIYQENSDVGATRNRGVASLDSEFVTFLDADDYMSVDCLEQYVLALSKGAMVVTSHLQIFENEKHLGHDYEIPIGTFEPFGACLDVLWQKNTVGGANFAIDKKLFERIGKFNEVRGSTHQDWQLLSRIAISGVHIQVVPKRLLNYRAVQNSMSRSRSHQTGQLNVIEEYLNLDEKKSNLLLMQLMRELSFSGSIVIGKPMTYLLAEKIRNFTEKYFPINSLRWKILARIVAKLL